MADLEQRITTLEALVRRLTESAQVSGYTQARHERYMQEHADWLHSIDKTIIEAFEHDEKLGQRIDSLVTDNKALGERIDSLVSSIGDLISRMPSKEGK